MAGSTTTPRAAIATTSWSSPGSRASEPPRLRTATASRSATWCRWPGPRVAVGTARRPARRGRGSVPTLESRSARGTTASPRTARAGRAASSGGQPRGSAPGSGSSRRAARSRSPTWSRWRGSMGSARGADGLGRRDRGRARQTVAAPAVESRRRASSLERASSTTWRRSTTPSDPSTSPTTIVVMRRPGPHQLRLVRPDRRFHSATADPRSSTAPSAPTRQVERAAVIVATTGLHPAVGRHGGRGAGDHAAAGRVRGLLRDVGDPEILGERGDSGPGQVVAPVAVHVDAVLDDVHLGELLDQPLGHLVGARTSCRSRRAPTRTRPASGRWPGRCRPRCHPRSSTP